MAEKALVVQGGRLIDGTGRPPIENSVIVIQGGRFQAVGKSGEVSLRVESMKQTGDSHPADAIGVQRNFDLFPTINTTIAQITYTGRF
jgi:hypothetical protein